MLDFFFLGGGGDFVLFLGFLRIFKLRYVKVIFVLCLPKACFFLDFFTLWRPLSLKPSLFFSV